MEQSQNSIIHSVFYNSMLIGVIAPIKTPWLLLIEFHLNIMHGC